MIAGPMIDSMEKFSFGDDAASADALLVLVLAGKKTATCGPLREYEEERIALPQAGQRSLILDGAGAPVCIIETMDVVCRQFDAVDAEFARSEGEGDFSLAAWRHIHEDFFRRNGGFSPDMMLVCRTFRVIERLSRSAQL